MKKLILTFSLLVIIVCSAFAQTNKDISTDRGNGLNDNSFINKTEIISTYNNVAESVERVFNEGTQWANKYEHFKMEMIYIILTLSIILLIIRLIRNSRGRAPLENSLHLVNWILLSLVSIVEIYYILSLGSNATWFCKPNEMGWFWTSINFLIFAFVVINQLKSYSNTLRDLQYNSYTVFSWNPGLYSWPIFVAIVFISYYFFEPGIIIAGFLLIAIQLFQIVLIFIKVIPKGGLGHAVLCSLVYLIGGVGTTLMLIHFIEILVVVLLGLVIAYFILSALGDSSSSGSAVGYCQQCGRKLDFSQNCKFCKVHYY